MSQTMKTILFFVVGSVALLVMIGFSGVKHSRRVLNDVRVDIETQDGNYFIDKADVMKLLQDRGRDASGGVFSWRFGS